jgi:hypothetical protein
LLLNLIFQLNSKTTHFRVYVYMNFFLCFDAKKSLLKFVQAFWYTLHIYIIKLYYNLGIIYAIYCNFTHAVRERALNNGCGILRKKEVWMRWPRAVDLWDNKFVQQETIELILMGTRCTLAASVCKWRQALVIPRFSKLTLYFRELVGDNKLWFSAEIIFFRLNVNKGCLSTCFCSLLHVLYLMYNFIIMGSAYFPLFKYALMTLRGFLSKILW